MQDRTEQQPKRRSRSGLWQYPAAPPSGAGADEQARLEAAARPPRRASAGADQDAARRGDRLATLLGWLSIGVGVASLLAPRAVARTAGLPQSPLLRAIGVREMACGIGLLRRRASPVWRVARVAGDAMDLTLLGLAAGASDSQRKRLTATAVAVAGVTALDVLASTQTGPWRDGAARRAGGAGGAQFKSVTVNRPPAECYRHWRDLEQLPRFMPHLESVRRVDERRWRWKAGGPAGAGVEWDVEITEDEPGRRLAWRAVDDDIDHGGAVDFAPAPGGRGTVVSARMWGSPPDQVGAAAGGPTGAEASRRIEADLRRFKQLLETGDMAANVGEPGGLRRLAARLFHAGRRAP